MFRTLLMLLLVTLGQTVQATTWDLADDWQDNTPQHLPWRYCMGDGSLTLLQWYASGTIGNAPPGYGNPAGANLPPSLFRAAWFGSAADDVAGHTPFSIVWVSPVSGWVKVTGAICQYTESTRKLRYRLWQGPSNRLIACGETEQIGAGADRVWISFSDGIGGANLYCKVVPGQTIHLNVAAVEGSTDTFAGVEIRVETVSGPPQIGARNLGMVVVSPQGPNDGGDFGAHTTGTQTCGLEEAFEYARRNGRDVFIRDGTYMLQRTLHVGWGEDWRIESGNAQLVYQPSDSGPALMIDSQMSNWFRLPFISAPNIQAGEDIVHVRPFTRGPDAFITCVASRLEIQGISGRRSGSQAYGNGLHLDASFGNVSRVDFKIGAISDCSRGIFTSGGAGVSHNWITCAQITDCNWAVWVQDGHDNLFRVTTDSPTMNPSTGVYLPGGSHNIFHLSTPLGGHPQGRDLIVSSDSNILVDLGLTNGYTNTGEGNQKTVFEDRTRSLAQKWMHYR